MLLKIIIAIFFFVIGLANGYEIGSKKTEKRDANYLYELQSKLDKTKK